MRDDILFKFIAISFQEIISNRNDLHKKMLSKPIYDILADFRRHIILICIYMFNVDTQKSHIWTSVSCFLSELGSIPLLLFIPSTNSGNYLSFSHSMDFSLSNFRRTMKIFSILFSINLEAIYNLMQMGGNYFSITAGDPL